MTLEVAAESDDWLVFRVIDRGAGMGQDVLDRIKKPYFTTRDGGSGLGVAVARGIVEQHGGRIEIESTPGGTTIVRVSWPSANGE